MMICSKDIYLNELLELLKLNVDRAEKLQIRSSRVAIKSFVTCDQSTLLGPREGFALR